MKTKFNFQGNIGDKVDFKYCPINGRYYSDGIEPVFNLIDGKELIKEDVKDLFIDPKDAFNIDEVPF